MKQSNTRSFITALGLTLAASGVWAQSAAPAASAPTATPAVTSATGTAQPGAAAMPGQHRQGMQGMQGKQGMQGMHGKQDHQAMEQAQESAVAKLGLSPAQKTQYDAAQAARKDLHAAKRSEMAARQKAMSEQLAKEQMDPRAMMAAGKQARAGMEAKRDAAEQKWLTFWDALSPEQRKSFTASMKTQHENRAQKPHGPARG